MNTAPVIGIIFLPCLEMETLPDFIEQKLFFCERNVAKITRTFLVLKSTSIKSYCRALL